MRFWTSQMNVSNERLKCSIKFFAFIIIITNEKKRVKYVIIKHAESPTYILSTQARKGI